MNDKTGVPVPERFPLSATSGEVVKPTHNKDVLYVHFALREKTLSARLPHMARLGCRVGSLARVLGAGHGVKTKEDPDLAWGAGAR